MTTCVAIAGATGFIGSALSEALCARGHAVIGLSRREPRGPATGPIEVRRANLFQLREVEQALCGAKQAVYLVHSMLPSARLSQGNFADLDLICADNFARAAKAAGVQRIVYVGGLLPEAGPLSTHLASRLEVEEALASHQVPLFALRAGIVFGPGGSSADMLINLVSRLPVLVLPLWCRSRCQPTSLTDMVRSIVHVLEHGDALAASLPAAVRRGANTVVIDVGNEDVLSYSDMLRRAARGMRRRRLFIPFPAFTPTLSLWWVSLVTSTSMALAGPLVGSLLCDLLVRPAHDAKRFLPGPWQTFDQSLTCALATHRQGAKVARPASATATKAKERARGVVSVQRLVLPAGRNAAWVASRYVSWLTEQALWLRPFVRIEQDLRLPDAQRALGSSEAAAELAGGDLLAVRFVLRGIGVLLLRLEFAASRSNPHRQLFYIRGGILTRPTDSARPGRFEFRSVLGQRFVLAAIYDFVPRLPWLIYKCTQAVVHALVMAGFQRHLARAAAEQAQRAAELS